jgi:hypothetical protein
MGKNQDSGSGIRDKHPGSATLEKSHDSQMWKISDYFKMTFAYAT